MSQASQAAAPVCIVTGGGQGIGRAIAERFLSGGYRIVIADRDVDACRETTGQLQSQGEALGLTVDIGHDADVIELMRQTAKRFGRLDCLINNAAIACNKPIEQLSLTDWNRVIGTNLTGTFLCSKHAAPLLRESRGAIVNLCSTRARMSEPHTEAYSASKGGIYALTHALAMSLGPEVRVNSISPGWIDVTGWQKRASRQPAALSEADHAQHPVGRVGRPEDIAALAWYLCSDQAGFITAQDFVVDGGMTRKMIYVE
ncbi:MAG: SDR family oxidoreductase [Gammaproteobacteria bacterium]